MKDTSRTSSAHVSVLLPGRVDRTRNGEFKVGMESRTHEYIWNYNEKVRGNRGRSPHPPPPANPRSVCTDVPDVYQRSLGRQRGPSAAVAFLCLLGDGGPDSSAT